MTHSNYVVHPHTQWRRREGALSSVFVWTSAWILNQRWRGGGSHSRFSDIIRQGRKTGEEESLLLFASVCLLEFFCREYFFVRLSGAYGGGTCSLSRSERFMMKYSSSSPLDEPGTQRSPFTKSGRRYLLVHMLLIIWYMFNDDVLCGTWGVPGLMLDGSWSVYW